MSSPHSEDHNPDKSKPGAITFGTDGVDASIDDHEMETETLDDHLDSGDEDPQIDGRESSMTTTSGRSTVMRAQTTAGGTDVQPIVGNTDLAALREFTPSPPRTLDEAMGIWQALYGRAPSDSEADSEADAEAESGDGVDIRRAAPGNTIPSRSGTMADFEARRPSRRPTRVAEWDEYFLETAGYIGPPGNLYVQAVNSIEEEAIREARLNAEMGINPDDDDDVVIIPCRPIQPGEFGPEFDDLENSEAGYSGEEDSDGDVVVGDGDGNSAEEDDDGDFVPEDGDGNDGDEDSDGDFVPEDGDSDSSEEDGDADSGEEDGDGDSGDEELAQVAEGGTEDVKKDDQGDAGA